MLRYLTNLIRSTALWILLLPAAVTFLGAASNQLVLFANNDKFPVMDNEVKIHMAEASEGGTLTLPDGTIMLDPVHCVMTSKTHLNILADIIDLHTYTESIGDLLLQLGEWLGTFCPFVWGALLISKIRRSSSDARA